MAAHYRSEQVRGACEALLRYCLSPDGSATRPAWQRSTTICYLQLTEEHYDKAVQNPVQQAAAKGCSAPFVAPPAPKKKPENLEIQCFQGQSSYPAGTRTTSIPPMKTLGIRETWKTVAPPVAPLARNCNSSSTHGRGWTQRRGRRLRRWFGGRWLADKLDTRTRIGGTRQAAILSCFRDSFFLRTSGEQEPGQ